MKKYIIILLSTFALFALFMPSKVSASSPALASQNRILLAQSVGQTQVASDGAWLTDPDVTFAGKTASRAASLFNWVLINYKWSYGDNTLVQFWAKIRNIVYAFLVLLVIITAFTMIITGGQSITAIQFLRKFLVVLFLITLSFAFIRFFYQIIDIVTGFFIRNPDGQVISSRDLFNMSFGYEDFIGWRRYGPSYDESAFVSLLLVKITAVTYYVMAGILIVRKVILWFFITVSPIYPILLLYFPIRNTAKIWLGEFFRWLLYAPLFTIFLSGLVYLYRDDINVMNFNFTGAGTKIVYPTAINILLGGPGQRLDITNSVNYNDTFAEYIIALIMVWVVIFLPFLLLRIFLDYLSNISINKDMAMNYLNNAMGYIVNKDRLFSNRPPSPITPKTPPSLQPTGSARQLPFSSGSAKDIAYGGASSANTYNQVSNKATTNNQRTNVYNQSATHNTNVANLKSANVNSEALHMVNFPIPTMRDVARFETSRLSNQSNVRQEVSKVKSTLEKIANPYGIQSSVEREHYSSIREKLFQAKLKGDQVASSILNAANNVVTMNQRSSTTNISNIANAQRNLHETIQKIANPERIESIKERQQFINIKERLTQESKQGNPLAATILNVAQNISTLSNSDSSFHQTLQKLANPAGISSVSEKEKFIKIKDQLVKESNNGNPVAAKVVNVLNNISQTQNTNVEKNLSETLISESNKGNQFATSILNTIGTTQNQNIDASLHETLQKIANPDSLPNTVEKQKFKDIKDKLIQDSKNGNPVAQSVLQTVATLERTAQKEEKGAAPAVSLPAVNQVQTVNLDDYENVKKMWLENYKKISVPQSIDKPNRTRQEWINEDLGNINKAISLLISGEGQKVSQGMSLVSNILPFLLIGGFSQNEVIAYLKAKEVAGETILKELVETAKTESENESLVSLSNRKSHRHASMHDQMAVSVSDVDVSSLSNSDEESEDESPLTASIARIKKQNEQITQILKMISLQVPSIAEVARVESAPLRSDTTRQDEVSSIQSTLQKIANPESITSPAEREHFTEIKQQLIHAKEQGDTVATSILNASQNISYVSNVANAFHQILQKLANPQSVISTTEREYFTQMKDQIVKKAQAGDPFATKIVNMLTTVSTSQNINEEKNLHDTIIQESKDGNQIATSLLTATKTQSVANTKEETITQLTTIVQTLAHTETLTNEHDKEVYSQAKETFEKESTQGNAVAKAVLQAVSNITNNVAIDNSVYQTLENVAHPETITNPSEKEKLLKDKEQIIADSKQGNPVAAEVLRIAQTLGSTQQAPSAPALLPTENQVQTVNLDDYENVKKLWIENYQKAGVPMSLDKPNRSREEWVSEDLKKIDKTISLLTSGQEQKVSEGMANVSNILPFLLIGGFSQSEMIAYLKAKEVAGQEVLRRIKEMQKSQAEDEETKLEVGNRRKDSEKELSEAIAEQPEEKREKEILVPVAATPTAPQGQQEDDNSLVGVALSNNQKVEEGALNMPIEDEVPQKQGGFDQTDIDSLSEQNSTDQQPEDVSTDTGEGQNSQANQTQPTQVKDTKKDEQETK